MSELELSRAGEIRRLHEELALSMRVTLDKACEIGRLLCDQKDEMAHGDFIPWVEATLPFTDRTARNYMRAYRNRDKLKTESVSDLSGAYRLLTISALPTGKLSREEWMEWLEDLTDEREAQCIAFKDGNPYFEVTPITEQDDAQLETLLASLGPGDLPWLLQFVRAATRLTQQAAANHIWAEFMTGKLLKEIEEWNAKHPDQVVNVVPQEATL